MKKENYYPLLESDEELRSLKNSLKDTSDKIEERTKEIQDCCNHLHVPDKKKGTETCTDCGHTQPITITKKLQLNHN